MRNQGDPIFKCNGTKVHVSRKAIEQKKKAGARVAKMKKSTKKDEQYLFGPPQA